METRCLDSEKEAKNKEKELKKEVVIKKETHKGLEANLFGLHKSIIIESTNNLNKELRQSEFLYQNVLTEFRPRPTRPNFD